MYQKYLVIWNKTKSQVIRTFATNTHPWGGPPPAMHSKRQPIPCHLHVERGLVLYIQYILPLGGESSTSHADPNTG